MSVRGWLVPVLTGVCINTAPVAGQEFALRGGFALSEFNIEGFSPFTDRYTGTAFGGHVRFRMGPIYLQPDILLVARGGVTPSTVAAGEETIKLEYLDLAGLIVLPVRAGSFEPYVFAGPHVSLETRCRSITEADGLKTNSGCTPVGGNLFDRRAFDYGVAGGAGIGHRLGGGKILLEGRSIIGLRNIYDGTEAGTELRNRTFIISLAYTLPVGGDDDEN